VTIPALCAYLWLTSRLAVFEMELVNAASELLDWFARELEREL
jgi:hypothetical protein